MSPHPTPSPLEFNPVLSRRVLLGGAGALAAAGRTQRLRLLFLQG